MEMRHVLLTIYYLVRSRTRNDSFGVYASLVGEGYSTILALSPPMTGISKLTTKACDRIVEGDIDFHSSRDQVLNGLELCKIIFASYVVSIGD